MSNEKRLLIVDDEPDFAEIVSEIAESLGFRTLSVTSGKHCLEMAPVFEPDIILLDLVMPDMDGMEVVMAMGRRGLKTQVILTTGYDETMIQVAEVLGDGNGLSMLGSVTKPARVETIEALLRNGTNEAKETKEEQRIGA
ncbi:response regulator [Nisaea sp.]|uniref:response regulator n=1 Tax=Nisaea sp. TaxID=2024842 RepID=UPI003B521873